MKIVKILIFIIFFFASLQGALAQPLDSGTADEVIGSDSMFGDFVRISGFNEGNNDGKQVSHIISLVIKAFLSLLGLIFIILMLIAGFNWMTAGGDEQKVSKAKDTIEKAVIGLIIIIFAYSITYFVFKYLPFGGSGGAGTTGGSMPIN